MMKAGVGDVDDIENAERQRHARCYRGIEAADQDAGYDSVSKEIEGKNHYSATQPPRAREGFPPSGSLLLPSAKPDGLQP